MNRLLDRFNKKVIKGLNLKQFGLFLTAAFVFLMLSKLSETRVETLVFSIEIDGLPKDIQLVNDSSLVLKAKVRSSGYGFLPISFGKLDPIVLFEDQDLKTYKSNTYLWVLGPSYENLQLKVPESFEVLTAGTDSVFFRYNKLSSKKVPVSLNAEFNFALGYDLLNSLKLSQDSVTVVGPLKVLDSVELIETEPLKLMDVKENIAQQVALKNPNENKLKFGTEEITVSGTVMRFTEGSVSIPVEVLNVPPGVTINYFPKTVSLSFYVDLESYKEISPDDFRVTCDFKEYENTGAFLLTPELEIKSERVKSARINITKVDFIFL
jgi:hypothetical protein